MIKAKSVELVSNTGGGVTATIDVNGMFRAIEIKPDQTDKPTKEYDVTVKKDNITLFTHTSLGRTANTIHFPGNYTANMIYPLAGTVQVIGAGMGSAKKTQVVLLIQD